MRKTDRFNGRLVAYRVIVPRGHHQPVQVADIGIGKFPKFAAPGVGSDAVYVGGNGHVVGFGF